MFLRTLSTSLLQIFCESMLHSKVIFKNMTGPDDTRPSTIFEGELFITTLSTTFLQIFCELTLHSKVILKSMTSPDDTYTFLRLNGLIAFCLYTDWLRP